PRLLELAAPQVVSRDVVGVQFQPPNGALALQQQVADIRLELQNMGKLVCRYPHHPAAARILRQQRAEKSGAEEHRTDRYTEERRGRRDGILAIEIIVERETWCHLQNGREALQGDIEGPIHVGIACAPRGCVSILLW